MLTTEQWRPAIEQAMESGFTWYNALTAYDNAGRSSEIVVTLHLMNRTAGQRCELSTATDRDAPELPDISDLFAGAAWGQRYVHDCYRVRFLGADLRPLLIHERTAPLRKDFVLGARAVTPFPAEGDRRGQNAGVPDPSVWGDRDPNLPAPSADEIVGAARFRRRRR